MAHGLNKTSKGIGDRVLRSVEELQHNQLISAEDADALRALTKRYSIAVTPEMAQIIQSAPDKDPIAAQFIPRIEEMHVLPQERMDPTGDYPHAPMRALVHRHRDRVLLKPTVACAVYCRFCFRREMIGPNGDTITQEDVDKALRYIAENSEIKEVILTGGDPLVLAPHRLAVIVQQLNMIPHVKWLRIHTRVPVVAPDKINAEMLNALRSVKAITMAVHANHAREFTPKAGAALVRLAHQGIVLLGQSVLLKGVNDTADALADLFETMMQHRIKPYYLHHPDQVTGTSHFRLPFEQGMRLMKAVRARVSGVCMPHYVVDIPGGVCKIPVTPETVCPDTDRPGTYGLYDDQGREFSYYDPI